jgi:ABC-type transport system involved in multi-copper enzyme maturation permease subunit
MKLSPWRARLLGPVLFYDLVCLARRRRYFVLRTLVPLLLLGLLWMSFGKPAQNGKALASGPELTARAGSFFYTFISVQFLLAILLTPAYTAGAVAEDQDRRRVDFLFATDLEDHEIVMGKLAARLANLLCLLLAGLPVLSFVQFWGGIDPELILVGYAAAALTVVSISSFSIYQSVRARRSRDAVVSTYLFLFGYLGLSMLASALLDFKWAAGVTILSWPREVTVGTLAKAFGAGNILLIRGELNQAVMAGKRLSSALPSLFLRYAVVHGVVAIVCMTAAVWQVRRIALTESSAKLKRKRGRAPVGHWLQPGAEPMLWKEVCVDQGLGFNRAGRVVVILIVVVSFVPAVFHLGIGLWQLWFSSGGQPISPAIAAEVLGQRINSWVRQVGIAVACLTILGAAIRGASGISGEHEQSTFDSLLASPLETKAILFAKWVGSLWSVRWGFLWLCTIWTIGILMGGLNHVSVPWLILCWVTYASFFAFLGLYFSARTNKTLAATLWTLSWTFFLAGGHALPWLLIGLPVSSGLSDPNPVLRVWAQLQVYGLAPPIAIGWFSFRGINFDFLTSSDHSAAEVLYSIAGCLVVWGLAGRVLWNAACNRLSLERIDPPIDLVADRFRAMLIRPVSDRLS